MSREPKAIIIAAGSLPAEDVFYRPLIEAAGYRVAADAGLAVFFRLQILPDLFVGDGDSVPPDAWAWAQANRLPARNFPVEKDATDTELALQIVISQGEREIDLLGGIGSRLDHTLANLYLLLSAYNQGVALRMIHPCHEVHLVAPSRPVTITGHIGDLVSVLPVTKILEGLTLRGLRWSMENGTLERCKTVGISNYLVAPTACIQVERGLGFVMKVREEPRQ